jgi:hypothetical protein
VRWWISWLALGGGCGRIAFDPAGATVDGRMGDGRMLDPDSSISGLVAWYPLDDGAGTIVRDASGHGHDASCTTCPTLGTGRVGGIARHFDGSSQFYEAPWSAELAFTSGYTASLWFSTERIPGNFDAMVSQPFGTTTDDSYVIDISATAVVEFYSQPSDSLYATSPIALGTWTHAAITWDGASKRIYTNGQMEGEVAGTAPTYDGHPFVIGADISDGSPAYFFRGTLADVKLFDRALMPSEILELAAP